MAVQTNSGAVVVPDLQAQATTNSDAERRYAGKFPTVEELEASYGHQMTETNKIIARAKETERQVEVLKALLNERGSGQQAGGNAQSAISQLAESGNLDPNQLQAAIREAVHAELAPVSAVMTARQRVGAEIPDFGSREPEIAVFLNANPDRAAEYEAMVANPATAAAGMRYIYREMEAAARRVNADPNADLSGRAQAEARLDAAIPGAGGGARAQAVAQMAEADLEELRKAAIGGGRAAVERYMAAKYGDGLSQR